MNASPPFHHITLTVSDIEKSGQWYQALLGPAEVIRREGDGWTRLRMNWSSGLVIAVTSHSASRTNQKFDHTQIGLDHLGLECGSEMEIRNWITRFDDLGIEHGPLESASYGWVVTARDPDGIPIEFFCQK